MRVRQIKARACARMGQRVARNFWASMRVVNFDYAGLAARVEAEAFAREATRRAHVERIHYDAWAMHTDMSTLVGGQEWMSRKWTSETLAFYNRTSFEAWLAAEEAANIEFADGLEGLLGTTDAAAAELDNYLKERGYEF